MVDLSTRRDRATALARARDLGWNPNPSRLPWLRIALSLALALGVGVALGTYSVVNAALLKRILATRNRSPTWIRSPRRYS